MREYLSPIDIANTVMMLKTAFKGTVVVVEGITDRRLYGKFFDPDNTEVVIAHSKDNVGSAVKIVFNERGYRSVIGIIDADLDYLLDKKRSAPLFTTDTRDNEMLMLRSGALEDVIAEYGNENSIEKFTESYGEVRDVVLDSCYPVGIMMYVSEKENMGLSFKDLDFNYFIDRRSLRCDLRKMVEAIVNNTNGRTVGGKRIYASLEKELQNERDPWIVCRGHDAMAVLAIALRYTFGGYNSKYIDDNAVAGSFRLAFDSKDMIATELYRKTKEWCDSNDLALWSI